MKREVLLHATVWMNLKAHYMKEARHKRAPRICFLLCEISRFGKSIEAACRLAFSRDYGQRGVCVGEAT